MNTNDDVHKLASALQTEMPGAWQEVKNSPFPGDPNDPDQKVLFLAIARGLLKYLSGRTDLISTFNETPAGSPAVNVTVNSIGWNLNISS